MVWKRLAAGLLGLVVALAIVLPMTRMKANAKEPGLQSGENATQPTIVLKEIRSTIDIPYEPQNEPQRSTAPLNPTTTEHYEEVDGYSWEYFLYEARPDGTNQPLILSLHGSGECGSGLEPLRYGGSLARYILDGSMEPDCIVLMPQCPSFGWDTKALKALLDHAVNETGADPSKLAITGVSMGGFGTWSMLAEYPSLFRYAAPIASNATDTSALAECTTKVLALSGTADGYDAQSGVDAIEAGAGSAEHVWVSGAGHGDMCNIYANEEHNPVPFLLGEGDDTIEEVIDT